MTNYKCGEIRSAHHYHGFIAVAPGALQWYHCPVCCKCPSNHIGEDHRLGTISVLDAMIGRAINLPHRPTYVALVRIMFYMLGRKLIGYLTQENRKLLSLV